MKTQENILVWVPLEAESETRPWIPQEIGVSNGENETRRKERPIFRCVFEVVPVDTGTDSTGPSKKYGKTLSQQTS